MPKKPTAKSTPVTVTIDASLKKLWIEANARLRTATATGALSWDERYEAIADIVEHQPPLYLAGGFATQKAFFEKSVGEDVATVYRNMRVAKYSTAKEVELYGASRLDAAITFVETKNGGPLKGRTPIDFATLRFPVKDGTKRLADATVEELRSAIATIMGHAHSSKKASPEASAISALLSKSKVKGVSFDVCSCFACPSPRSPPRVARSRLSRRLHRSESSPRREYFVPISGRAARVTRQTAEVEPHCADAFTSSSTR